LVERIRDRQAIVIHPFLNFSCHSWPIVISRQVVSDIAHNITGTVAEFTDNGISGAKGRDARPGLDNLLQAVARRDIDMVMAWSVVVGVGVGDKKE
jgi:hypothetical protein